MTLKKKRTLGMFFAATTVAIVPIATVVACGTSSKADHFINQGSYQNAGRILKAEQVDLVPIYSDARKDFDKDIQKWALEKDKKGTGFKNTEIIAVSEAIQNDGIVSKPGYSKEVNNQLAKIFTELVNIKEDSFMVDKKNAITSTYGHTGYRNTMDGQTSSASTEPTADGKPIKESKFKEHNSKFGKEKPHGIITIEFVASRDPQRLKRAAEKIVPKLQASLKKQWKEVTKVVFNVANDYSVASERVASGTSDIGFLPFDTFSNIVKKGKKDIHMFAQASRDAINWDVPVSAGQAETDLQKVLKKANDTQYFFNKKGELEMNSKTEKTTFYRSILLAKKGKKINGVLLKDLFENPTKEKWDKVKDLIRIGHGSETSGGSYMEPQEIFRNKFNKFGFESFKKEFGL
ncbi:MAG: PhnD/SsuA/transferrin family substrate-binding protein [Mycoplasma sp.]|nr:PhnD/SsuA/transferrin family substrate-binding protein [Mycoplasma sp.]